MGKYVLFSYKLIKKILVRKLICSRYRVHAQPLVYTDKILSVTEINTYLSGIFMFQFAHKEAPELFLIFYQ